MILRAAILGLILATAYGVTASAQSFGHYHLPSTLPQFCGLGYGAGHHVPMIRVKHCHPSRISRYVHTEGCDACGALPMECFLMGCSPQCHSQLDQILQGGEYGKTTVPASELPMHRAVTPSSSILPTPSSEL